MGRHVPVAALLALILGACAWRGPKTLQTWPGVDASDDVIALDKAAYKLVAVQNQVLERTPQGQFHIKLELANLSAQDLPVQVQTQYRDDKGMLTGESTPFTMIVLPGNGSALYETTSLDGSADRFTVQIKTP